MAAIKKLVFDDKKYTLEQLNEALKADFVGYDQIKTDCLNAPKYGNDDDYADLIASDLVDFTEAEHRKYKTLYSHLSHGTLSISNNTPFGQMTGASAKMCIRDSNYRYYSEETLLLVPVVKYYKQMGFSLEQMQSLVEGSTYQCLERSFLSKSEELQTERQELLYRYTAVKDWYELVREAELVSQRKEHDVTIKYVNSTVYCSKEQDFSYNYMESISNIPWVNYLESIHNEITCLLYTSRCV